MLHDGLEYLYHTIPSKEFDVHTNTTTLIVMTLTDLLGQFPERIMIPTIHALGIISINRTYGTGVHLIGLNNNPKYADDDFMYPDIFFDHDIEHSLGRKIDNSKIPAHFQRRLGNLPKTHRELVETIYFELTHEKRGMLTDNIKAIKALITDIRGNTLFTKLILEVHEELGLNDISN